MPPLEGEGHAGVLGGSWQHGPARHAVERLTRVDEKTIRYEATIDDPSAYTGVDRVVSLEQGRAYRIFEYACHEGNHALEHMLSPRAMP
jgi:hypothetical protein